MPCYTSFHNLYFSVVAKKYITLVDADRNQVSVFFDSCPAIAKHLRDLADAIDSQSQDLYRQYCMFPGETRPPDLPMEKK